jgi:hypothetical protein
VDSIQLPNNQPAALLGDTLVINGFSLAGESGDPASVTVIVRLTTARLSQPIELEIADTARTDTQITVQLPNTPGQLPAGFYTLAVLVMPDGKSEESRSTNETPLLVAPKITGGLTPVARTDIQDGLGTATITLTCSPDVLVEQRVTIVLGDREVVAEPRSAAGDPLIFVARHMAAGEFRVRLRVDGVESLLIDRSDPLKPTFDESQKITLT